MSRKPHVMTPELLLTTLSSCFNGDVDAMQAVSRSLKRPADYIENVLASRKTVHFQPREVDWLLVYFNIPMVRDNDHAAESYIEKVRIWMMSKLSRRYNDASIPF